MTGAPYLLSCGLSIRFHLCASIGQPGFYTRYPIDHLVFLSKLQYWSIKGLRMMSCYSFYAHRLRMKPMEILPYIGLKMELPEDDIIELRLKRLTPCSKFQLLEIASQSLGDSYKTCYDRYFSEEKYESSLYYYVFASVAHILKDSPKAKTR